jgi:hypothetical protein
VLRNKFQRPYTEVELSPESTSRSPSVLEVKQEISTVLRSPQFKQAPRLRSLFEYVCQKALLHEGRQTTEYTIAVDVFGKTTDFKDSRDSSIRVEIYRLRKRLAQFYENEGRDRPIRIFIPHGGYAPEFVFTEPPLRSGLETPIPPIVSDTAKEVPEAVEKMAAPGRVEQTSLPSAPPSMWSRRWIALALVTGVLAALGIGAWLYRTKRSEQFQATLPKPPADTLRPVPAPPGSNLAFTPIRIMAGYTGPVRRDIAGAEWSADKYFRGGRPSHRDIPRIGRTHDALLFQNSRIGDCAYDIPLPPGTYELHLYFVEPEYGPEVGRGENDRTFFLHLNDVRIVPAIDIESEAMGPNIVDERVFKEIHPGPDGKLHISFESATGVPLVNAIKLLPGLPHAQLPIRLGTHPVPFTDHLGNVWQADDYYLNGQTCPRNQAVTGTPDPALFALERYGHFDYAIPVDVRGSYTVALHFAEFYFGPQAPGHGGVGSRIFNVTCNGVLLLQNLDIFKEVGNSRALTKTAYHLKPSAQGKLNLTFEPVVNYALIDGIEVFDESK